MSMRMLQVVVLLSSGVSLAQVSVPSTMSFTARLVDNGMPVQGSKSFVFTIFPALTGGTEVWTESQTVMVTDGTVNAELGVSEPLNDTIFSGAKVFLEVKVDGTVLSPRSPLLSVPYALRAGVANKVGTLAETDIQKRVSSAGCPTGSSIRMIDALGNVTCQTANVTVAPDGGSTGLTGVFGRGGLSGGGTMGDINLSVEFAGSGTAVSAAHSDHTHTGTYLPLSSSLSCSGTDKVSGINASTGAVTCSPDTVGSLVAVTSVATGAGLTGGPITTTGTIGIANNGVTNAMLANSGVTINTGGGLTGGGAVSLGGNISLGTSAGGDLSGNLGAAKVTGLNGTPVSATAPTLGQVPMFAAGSYVPTSPTFGAAGHANSGVNIPLNTITTAGTLTIPTLPSLGPTAVAKVTGQGSLQVKVSTTVDCTLAIQVRTTPTGLTALDPGYLYYWFPANFPSQVAGSHLLTLPFTSTGMLPLSNTYYIQVFALGCVSLAVDFPSISVDFINQTVPATFSP